jgi:hypothetical protein
MRWALLLPPFRFRIEAIKGKENVVTLVVYKYFTVFVVDRQIIYYVNRYW